MYRIDRLDVSPDMPFDASLDEQLEFCRRHLVRVNGRRRISRADEIGLAGGLRRIRGRSPIASVGAAWRWARKRVTDRFMPLHTTACGDFTLLARDAWFRLRGYPELQMYSLHHDSILCYTAHYSGVREVVLKGDMRMYHLDHSSGWSTELAQRMRSIGLPFLDDEQFRSYIRVMHERRSPTIFNDESWGLATEDLVETDPVTRRAEAPR
ncbi:MAG TPA: hypothetical protein VEW91_00445 [bacterium]|nr:hypothetical protein [bacterium]